MNIGTLNFDCEECPFSSIEYEPSGQPCKVCPHDYDPDLLDIEFDGDNVVCNGPKSIRERAELVELRMFRDQFETICDASENGIWCKAKPGSVELGINDKKLAELRADRERLEWCIEHIYDGNGDCLAFGEGRERIDILMQTVAKDATVEEADDVTEQKQD